MLHHKLPTFLTFKPFPRCPGRGPGPGPVLGVLGLQLPPAPLQPLAVPELHRHGGAAVVGRGVQRRELWGLEGAGGEPPRSAVDPWTRGPQGAQGVNEPHLGGHPQVVIVWR